MKVLHILDHSLPQMSGYAVRSETIARTEQALGLDVAVLTSPNQGPAPAPVETRYGIPHHRSPSFFGERLPHRIFVREALFLASFARTIDRVVREESPDVLHAHSPSLVGLPALRVARRRGLPVVYEARSSWEDAGATRGSYAQGSPTYRLSRALETKLFRAVDAVVTLSAGLREDIVARGVAPDRVTVVPNGVDPDRFTPRPRSSELEASLDLRGKPVVGFVGSFHGYEGLPLLLEAFARLHAQDPSLRLLLVGGGEDDARLRETAAQRGLDDAIRFTGRVPHEQVLDYCSLIDVFVYPRLSLRVTELVTALKPLEAMAMERCVVASDVGGNRELVEDGATGLLFRAGDVDDLAATLRAALADPERRRTLGAAGRRRVIEERSWRALVARDVALYRRLV
ncbi:MAG: TIGR04063 family PEP-CTERM/XrtA system glycosyltransferase, partial [Hyphomicrobiales bacterium]